MRGITSVAITIWLLSAALGGAQAQTTPAPRMRWFKGNTHAHTLKSDGDSTAEELARWYRQQLYHFVIVTDHNFVTPVELVNDVIGAVDRFLVISGEEISDQAGGKPVHVNALGTRTIVAPQGGATVAEALQRDVAAARSAGSVPQINHPNFGWAVSPPDLPQERSATLLEIYNGHPQVNNLGGGGAPSAEALWDQWLSAGHTVYGVASDDTHELLRPWSRQAASPGRGWVMVRAARLSPDDILAALASGDFYATTGVELAQLDVTPAGVSVAVRVQATTRYHVQFIGKGGRVLKEVDGASASYDFTGDEGYVRVKITDSNGLAAWTQAAPAAQAGTGADVPGSAGLQSLTGRRDAPGSSRAR